MVIISALGVALVSGCALLELLTGPHHGDLDRHFLPPLPAARDAIDLEVYFVDRAVGDPLSGDSLWKSLNQAVCPVASRAQLRQAGLQYAIAPSTPPFALRALLDPARSTGTARQTSRQALPIPAGEWTFLTAASLPEARTIPSSDKAHPVPLEVTDAFCMFRMTAERVQDGWIRITFIPEIHHGPQKMRPIATDREWVSRNTQATEPYYDQQFSVELNTGEYVVIGLEGDDMSSLGGLFFRGGDPKGRINRLMIVRLAGMHDVQPVRSHTSGH